MAAKKKSRRKSASKKRARSAAVTASSKPAPRGRRADPVETERRVAMMARVDAGELDNRAAAAELGLKLGTWQVWQWSHKSRTGGGGGRRRKKATRKASKRAARQMTALAADVSGLEQTLTQVRDLAAFAQRLKRVLRELLAEVEGKVPG